jgi:two-component system, cell cycle response regulator
MSQYNTAPPLPSSQQHLLAALSNRETILSSLLRETDRVQRTNSPLSILLFDIDDFAFHSTRLGPDLCDQLLCSVAGRTMRLLRTYDLFGRPGTDAFLIGLPGCNLHNAVMLAERIRTDVFGPCFQVAAEPVCLTACLGVASSQGRSPLVVLREAECALQSARENGPDSIQCGYEGLGAFSGSACVRNFSDGLPVK